MGGSMQRASLGLVVILSLHLLAMHNGQARGELQEEYSEPDATNLCVISDPLMDPFHEVRSGQDVVWQIPPNPKAVLFIGHGMDREPLSYFDPGSNCTQCYGLPEDRAAVLAALQRSYAVIMVKSVGTYWLPWNVESWPPIMSEDRVNVKSIIKGWTREHSLEHLPLALFGYSSGGNFSTLLTLDLDVKSLIVMCTSGELMVLERADKAVFPPTFFVPMPADNGPLGFYPLALKAMDILKSRGVSYGEFDVWPRPLSPSYFTERILCLDITRSDKIYRAYKEEGWLNEHDYLIKNPRIEDWEGVLRKSGALPFCKSKNDLCLANHVRQELMNAFAEHSFTSSANEAIFGWLDSTLFSPADGLLASL